jgi:septin family protein
MIRGRHDLVISTNEKHYSKYRVASLRKTTSRAKSVLMCDDDYLTKLEDSRQKMLEDLSRRESEIKEHFVQKVKDKEAQLREAEEKVSSTYYSGGVTLTCVYSCLLKRMNFLHP